MEKIYQHIEKLLSEHDYVVVPNFGGFVTQLQSAVVLIDRIKPPVSTISFNPLMHNADGLLAIEISRNEGISYRMSVEYIDREVNRIKSELNRDGKIQFGSFGVLMLNASGNILFAPNQNMDFLPQNLGLSDLFVEERNDVLSAEPRRITFTLPSTRFYKYAAAGMLIFGLMFVTPKVNDVRRNNTASLVSVLPMNTSKSITKLEVDTVVIDKTPTSTAIVDEPQKYHVVVSSLHTLESAEGFCKTLSDDEFKEAHVISSKKIYRVAIKSFVERSQAIEYMEVLRKSDSRFDTAWVLCED